jgi:glucoamylase
MLSEVFYPTTDTPAAISLQFVVTDGRTFADQIGSQTACVTTRPDDLSLYYVLQCQSMAHGYTLTEGYLSDPARPTLLLSLRLAPAPGKRLATYRLYLRYNPALNGNAVQETGRTAGSALLAGNPTGHYGPVASALLARPALQDGTTGFAGTASDPFTPLTTRYKAGIQYAAAGPGNIVQGALVPLQSDGAAELALGFGPTEAAARRTASATLATPYARIAAAFAAGWHQYAASLLRPDSRFTPAQRHQFYAAALTLKASEDKRYPGAIVASLSVPWGQIVPATQGSLPQDQPPAGNGGSGQGYHKVWVRDLYEMASGLAAAGDLATARDIAHYMLATQELMTGGVPQNTLVDGTVVQTGQQMDEVAYPLILAWSLGLDDRATYLQSLRPLADYLARHGPATGQERWEENAGYSPSTIAAEIAGLAVAGAIASRDGDPARAQAYRAIADDWQRNVKRWTVTTSGPLAHQPYFIRIDDDLNPNDGGPIAIAGGPSRDERQVVDAGFLELVRLGVLPPTDPAVVASLAVIDRTIRAQTPDGPVWYRYNFDNYGDSSAGAPWSDTQPGTGHPWPVLDGERAEYDLSRGNPGLALAYLEIMRRAASPTGLIPEQIWERPALPAMPGGVPATASIGFTPGHADGSARPLNWALGQYIRLVADLQAGAILEQPAPLTSRYITHPVRQAALSVLEPAGDLANHTGLTLPIAGKVAPGARVVIFAQGGIGGATVLPPVGQDGSFRLTITLPNIFLSKIWITAQDRNGNTAAVLRVIR